MSPACDVTWTPFSEPYSERRFLSDTFWFHGLSRWVVVLRGANAIGATLVCESCLLLFFSALTWLLRGLSWDNVYVQNQPAVLVQRRRLHLWCFSDNVCTSGFDECDNRRGDFCSELNQPNHYDHVYHSIWPVWVVRLTLIYMCMSQKCRNPSCNNQKHDDFGKFEM